VTGNGTLGAHPVTVSGENLVIVETGLYTIDYTINLPSTFRPTGSTRAYVAISAWNYIYRASLGEEDWGTVSTGPIPLVAGSVISFPFYLSGSGVYNFTGRISILRHE